MRLTRRTRRPERGAQLVEMALATPLLLMLLFVLIEAASMARVHQVINNAAREGARVSTLPEHKGQTNDIATQVVNYASQNGVTISSADVTIDQNATIPGPSGVNISASHVSVSYAYVSPFSQILTWAGLPASFGLQGAARFRNLY